MEKNSTNQKIDNDLINRKRVFIEDAQKYYNGKVFVPDDFEKIDLVWKGGMRLKMEIIDLYNGKREKLNKTFIREDGEPEDGEYKLSVHVWILNNRGEILIQKRNENLKRNPGKWAFTGGIVDSGETSVEGAIRESKEELGIDIDKNKIERIGEWYGSSLKDLTNEIAKLSKWAKETWISSGRYEICLLFIYLKMGVDKQKIYVL